MNVAVVARKLTCLIEEYLVNEKTRDCIVPNSTTTTDNDIAVTSMTMMATLQKYFDYSANTGCSFPSLTLLGERNDWVQMRQHLDQLPNYGQ